MSLLTNQVKLEITKLGNNKTPGYDRVDSKLIKTLSRRCVIYLKLLYNLILRLQHFPTQWKCA